MKKEYFSSDWHFFLGEVALDQLTSTSFTPITIPHTWNNLDGEDGEDDYKRLTCTYVKFFKHEKMNRRVYIEFEGANSISKVYLNGVHLGTHEGGYSRFRYEMTDYLKSDNELVVYVDNRYDDTVYPLTADFTFFGGLYRPVNLVYSEHVSFDVLHKGAEGVYVSQTHVTQEKADMKIDAYVETNQGQEVQVTFVSKIMDHRQNIIDESSKHFVLNRKAHVSQTLTVMNPRLWHGISDPYLYHVVAELYVNHQLVDERLIPTGLRYFHVDHETFYLNGEPYKLFGVCRHQDREHLGNALTKKMHEEDMALIAEIGANSIRLAHYQQADEIYQLCDQYGFVVWAEIPYISRTSSTDLSGMNALHQMEELIKQNYNHSSICMWGVGNEITLRGERLSSNEIYDKLHQVTKKIDPYRLSTIAQLANIAFDDYHNDITDLIGYNLYFGWYVGKAEDLNDWLKQYRIIHPKKPVCISEYGAEGIINIHAEEPKAWDYSEEYQAWYHETMYQIIEKTPFIWGSYVWNMFTFASDSRAEGNTKGINNKGLISHDRRVKKDAFYYYQAKWTKKPMLHLTAKRFTHRTKESIEVKAYSNQKSVDFYHNHQLIATVYSDQSIFKTVITLSKGENHVKVASDDLTDEMICYYDVNKKNDKS